MLEKVQAAGSLEVGHVGAALFRDRNFDRGAGGVGGFLHVSRGLFLARVTVAKPEERNAHGNGVVVLELDSQAAAGLERNRKDAGNAFTVIVLGIQGPVVGTAIGGLQAAFGKHGHVLAAKQRHILSHDKGQAQGMVLDGAVGERQVERLVGGVHNVPEVQADVGLHGVTGVVQRNAQRQVVGEEILDVGRDIPHLELAVPDVKHGKQRIARVGGVVVDA